MAVSTSAAARLNVLWPETNPANAGVTNVGSWKGTQSTARIQSTPLACASGSAGFPAQVRIGDLADVLGELRHGARLERSTRP